MADHFPIVAVWLASNVYSVHAVLRKRIEFIASFGDPAKTSDLPDLPIDGRKITDESFGKSASSFRNEVKVDDDGYFGTCPAEVREVLSESCSMMGGLSAALSQLAHPFVAYGIKQHSYTRGNPMLRFYNTFKYVFAVTFGTFDEGLRSMKTVAAVHRRIRGKIEEEAGAYPAGFEYTATDEAAAIWVGATLTDYSVFMFEMMRRPLTEAEKEKIFEHYRRLSVVWGIDPASQPPTWKEFQIYNARMYHSNILTVTSPARDMFDIIVNPLPWERWTGLVSTRIALTVLLPSPVARQFGLHQTRFTYAFTIAFLGVVRAVYNLLPPSLRCYTRYGEWESRHNGRGGALNLPQKMASAFGGWFIDSYLKFAGR